MSIVKYVGQPTPPGTIVCRESVLKAGICAYPVRVVAESTATVTIKDLRDGDERRRAKSSIAFICDTEAEGITLYEGSMEFARAEQKLAEQQAAERAGRKREAIYRLTMGNRT